MSGWRQAVDRIGGPDAVTWPAFWITLVGGVAGHLATAGTVAAPVVVRVILVLAAQLVMFALLVGLRFTLLRDPARPRPWVAIGGFVVAAVARGIVLTSLLLAIGAVDDPRWLYRISAALLNQMVLLVVVALVVSTMRAHTRSLAELIRNQRELAVTQGRIAEEVTSRNEDLLARVQERLRTELSGLDAMQGAASIGELQRLASDVVRPMSHELAESVPVVEAPRASFADARVTWQQVARQMVDRPPLRPLIAAAFLALLLATVTLGVYGPQGVTVTLVHFGCVLALSALANLALARVLPHAGPRTALGLVIGAGLLIGTLAAAAASLFLPAGSDGPLFVVGGGFYSAVVIVLSALVTAILRQQRGSERELAASTEHLRRELVRLRQARWLQHRALARALHGPVQSAVTSAALRLDAAVRAGEPDQALVADIREELRSVVDVLDVEDAEAPSLDLAFARITGTWEGVCTVQSSVSDQARDALEADPMASAVIIDVMTEAVSNAVRHGSASRAELSISADDDGLVTLSVCNNGLPSDGASVLKGLGTSLLDDCALEWSRTTTEGRTLLAVVLPLASAPR